MIKVVEFCTRKADCVTLRASSQLEEYLFDNCIKREQIISITQNPSNPEYSRGDTIMLVYEE